MVRAIAAYLDFCYLVHLPTFSESDLAAIDDALERYVQERQIFVDVGVCPKGISMPRQHALQHYHRLIEQFGAPNGLSTSITESMHIDAVKEPWH
jgi:precorrin isomerase